MNDFQSEQLDYGGDRTRDLKHSGTLTTATATGPLILNINNEKRNSSYTYGNQTCGKY